MVDGPFQYFFHQRPVRVHLFQLMQRNDKLRGRMDIDRVSTVAVIFGNAIWREKCLDIIVESGTQVMFEYMVAGERHIVLQAFEVIAGMEIIDPLVKG